VTEGATDPSRAAFHIQPARGWTNDPNGMLFRDGRWHVFFQHNSAAPVHTDIHWGHVSSDDMVSWREHPVAFGPAPGGPDRAGCWSGVCLDLGDRVAAVYTGIATTPVESTVCLRYASDPDLDAWSPPVVVALVPPLPGSGPQVREMRDPFLFEWEGRRWALLGAGLSDGSPAVLLWSCDNLGHWQFERIWVDYSDQTLREGAPAEIWECPQLVEVDGSWVLLLSLWQDNQLEGTVAAVGSLTTSRDGSPVFSPRRCSPVDEGRSLYAPQVALDADGPWFVGWVMQVGVPGASADDAVAGCLTLVRRLDLADDRLLGRVDPRQAALLGAPVEASDGRLPASVHVSAHGAGVTLRGTELSVTLQAGAEAWLDGEVLEVYPPDAPPRTYRDLGTAAWQLVGSPEDATVRQVRQVRQIRQVRADR
jgi:beta-fructofuranosidase